jgi:4-hydroxybutyrate CoA-transferase
MDWKTDYQQKLVTAEEAVRHIKSGDIIGMAGGNSTPPNLVNALTARYRELENVVLCSGLMMYPFELFKPEYRGHITFKTIFMAPLERYYYKERGNVEPISFHLSRTDEIIDLMKPTVYLCDVSPPDKRGYMCLGPLGIFHGIYLSRASKTVILQVNENVPILHGVDNLIHVSEADYIVEKNHPLPVLPDIPTSEEEKKIGEFIAERIPDGATIQLGIGGTSNSVGHLLVDKKDLGIHTEMFTDSMMTLAKMGVVTGRKKNFRPGKMVASFTVGSQELYEFLDDNPMCEFAPIYDTNDVFNIARNDNMVSINNTIAADITGQCASESLGHALYSGTGGQVDFIRGSMHSRGGMSFIALPSVSMTKDGPVSRIVSTFLPGTIVTTPRADVHYIVTEYGVADLRLRSVSEKVKEMIKIAHPDFRDRLKHDAEKSGMLY